MNRLAAVDCTLSRGSIVAPGDADVITFSGFGTWSKDNKDAAPRFAAVQISITAEGPYVGIQIFGQPDAEGNPVISSANTKPPDKPIP